MFKRLSLDLKPDTFNDLIAANEWETYDRNRQGAVLVRHEQGLEHDYTPFVRTTTVCTMPSQPFSPLHFAIIDQIKESARHPLDWNNAAAEVYDPGYKTMRFHCDQGLDLRPGSYIGIFSCYDDPKEPCPRRLVTRRKDGKATSEVFLAHNSAVLFSTVTNDQYVHKIVGPRMPCRPVAYASFSSEAASFLPDAAMNMTSLNLSGTLLREDRYRPRVTISVLRRVNTALLSDSGMR